MGALVLSAGVLAAIVKDRASEDQVAAPNLPAITLEDVAQIVDRPGLGITFEIPAEWTVQRQDPGGGMLLATSDPGPFSTAWVRVLRYPGENVLTAAQRVVSDVVAKWTGVRDVVSGPTVLGARAGWYASLTAPASPDGNGPLMYHRYWFLPVDTGVVALTTGALNPAMDNPVFDRIALSVRFTAPPPGPAPGRPGGP